MRIVVELTESIFEELISQQIKNLDQEVVEFCSSKDQFDRLYKMSLAMKEMSRLIRAMSKTLEENGMINPGELSLENESVNLENQN